MPMLLLREKARPKDHIAAEVHREKDSQISMLSMLRQGSGVLQRFGPFMTKDGDHG